MNKLKIIIIAIITVIIFLIFFLAILSSNRRGSTPLPNALPTPTPLRFSEKELYITSIAPKNNLQPYLPAQPLQITFTQEVAVEKLLYTIFPPTEVLIVKSAIPKTLILAPKTFWANGETTITILPTTVSINGNTLKNPQTYKINVAIPTIPDIEGAY
ncbi:MAG TPA: hypothetical protein PKA38_00745 [Candidatus Levybacteria bacterium]|nr:hypothetical protein [Candidatus Levybacteria bacterium]